MKKYLMMAVLFSSALFADEIKITSEYKINAFSSYDSYVYEWTPKENKDVRCIFVVNPNKGESGVACYEVSK